MKRRKILVLIPALGLLLTGCTFQEGFATAKHWIGQNIYHPLKDWIDGLMGKKEEPKPEPTPEPEPGPGVVTPVEITEVRAPESIEQDATLDPASVPLTVKYSDNTTQTHAATEVRLDTSKVAVNVKGTAYYNDLSKEFTIDVVAPSTKEVKEIKSATGPESVYVGSTLSVNDFSVTVEYTDGTEGTVKPDSVEGDTSVAAESVAVTLHVGELTTTVNVAVVEQPPVVTKTSVISETDDLPTSYKMNDEHFLADESGMTIDYVGTMVTTVGSGESAYKAVQFRANDGNLWNGSPVTGGITKITMEPKDLTTEYPHIYVGHSKNPTEVELTGSEGVFNVTGTYEYFAIKTSDTSHASKYANIKIEYNNEIPAYTIPASKVELNKAALEIGYNDSFTFVSTVLPVAAAEHQVIWNSSDPSVATISDAGVLTSLAKDGTTNITATVDGVVATCAVTVSSSVVKAYASYAFVEFGELTGELNAAGLQTVFANNCTGTNVVSSISAISKVYKDTDSIKCGTGSAKGSFTAALSENITKIRLRVKAFDNAQETFVILVNDTEVTITKEYAEYEVSVESASSLSISAKVASKNRFYISHLELYK